MGCLRSRDTDAKTYGGCGMSRRWSAKRDLGALVGELRGLAKTSADPITSAAQAATRAFGRFPRPEGEIFALWTADFVLAVRLGWERPAPLLMTKILEPLCAAALLARGRAPPTPIGCKPWPTPMRLRPPTRTPWLWNCRDDPKSCSPSLRNRVRNARHASSNCCFPTIASRPRGPRNAPVFRIVPRVDCLTVWSTWAPCANCRGERVFGFTGCDRQGPNQATD